MLQADKTDRYRPEIYCDAARGILQQKPVTLRIIYQVYEENSREIT